MARARVSSMRLRKERHTELIALHNCYQRAAQLLTGDPAVQGFTALQVRHCLEGNSCQTCDLCIWRRWWALCVYCSGMAIDEICEIAQFGRRTFTSLCLDRVLCVLDTDTLSWHGCRSGL